MNHCFQYIHCLLDQVDVCLGTHMSDPEYFPGQFTIIASHDHPLHSQFRIQALPSHMFRHVNRGHSRGTRGSFHGVDLQSHLLNPFTAVGSHLLVTSDATLQPSSKTSSQALCNWLFPASRACTESTRFRLHSGKVTKPRIQRNSPPPRSSKPPHSRKGMTY